MLPWETSSIFFPLTQVEREFADQAFEFFVFPFELVVLHDGYNFFSGIGAEPVIDGLVADPVLGSKCGDFFSGFNLHQYLLFLFLGNTWIHGNPFLCPYCTLDTCLSLRGTGQPHRKIWVFRSYFQLRLALYFGYWL